MVERRYLFPSFARRSPFWGWMVLIHAFNVAGWVLQREVGFAVAYGIVLLVAFVFWLAVKAHNGGPAT